jgi:hypothetical protein
VTVLPRGQTHTPASVWALVARPEPATCDDGGNVALPPPAAVNDGATPLAPGSLLELDGDDALLLGDR